MSAVNAAGNKMSNLKKKKVQGRVLYGRSSRTNMSNTSRSFSQSMISKAAHKSRIKSLLQNNKVLAKTLEYTQCDLVNKEKMITSLQQSLNHHTVLRLKVQSMSQTAKKLIAEVQDVVSFLDCEMMGKPPESSQPIIVTRKRSLDQDFDALSAESSEVDNSDSTHNEAAIDHLPTVVEVSDDICTTPKIQSSLILKQRAEAKNKERTIGICDLTAIKEVSLVADDPALPPLLFMDDDDEIGEKRSLSNNGKSPEVNGRTPELFISPYASKKSCETNNGKKSQTNVRKSNRASICGRISDTVPKVPDSIAISKTRIPKKINADNKIKSTSNSQIMEEKRDTVTENNAKRSEQEHNAENRRGTFVVNSANNTAASKSNKRGTFVMNDGLKSPDEETIKKSRATFVVPNNNSESKTGAETAPILVNKETEFEDRRATFVKSSSKPDATSNINHVSGSDVLDGNKDYLNGTASSKANDALNVESVSTVVTKDATPPAFNQTVLLHEDMELTGVLNVLPHVIKQLNAQQPLKGNESSEVDVGNENAHINKKNDEQSTIIQGACVISGNKMVIEKEKEQSVVVSIQTASSVNLPINKEKKDQDKNKTSKKKNGDGLLNKRDKISLKTSHNKKTIGSPENSKKKTMEKSDNKKSSVNEDASATRGVIDSQMKESSSSSRCSTRLRNIPKKSYAIEEIDLELNSKSDKDSDYDICIDEDIQLDTQPEQEKFKRMQGEKQRKFFFTKKRKHQATGKEVIQDEEKEVLQKSLQDDDDECKTQKQRSTDSCKKKKSTQLNVVTKRKKTSHHWNDIGLSSDSDSDFCFGLEHSKKPKRKPEKSLSSTDSNDSCVEDNSSSNPPVVGKNLESKENDSSKSKKEEKIKLQQRKEARKNFSVHIKKSHCKIDENEFGNSEKLLTTNENPANLIFKDKPEFASEGNPESYEAIENVNDKTDAVKSSELKIKSNPKLVRKEKKKALQVSEKLASNDGEITLASEHKKSTKKVCENSLKTSAKNNCDKENQMTSSTIIVQAEINRQIPDIAKGKSFITSSEQNMQPVVILRDTFASIKNVLDSDFNLNELEKSSDTAISRKTSLIHSKLSSCSFKTDAAIEDCPIVRTTDDDDDFTRPNRRSRHAVSYKEPSLNSKMRRIK